MKNVDKRGKLQEEVFEYKIFKGEKVFIYWKNKIVKTLYKKEAKKFIDKIDNLSGVEAQLLMAKTTGNFKRGNEKDNKDSKHYGE
ncbi:hypothetical protein [Miniphocaeibacter massiliensis]|uniref:hypothetical protein n=1 Tax=Miniphocaeibacter massiliensis TaxID=2041841 RepID=UPI000C1C0F1D|nr:hypothetical protein [Miniphocaeibacter massiliensis]